LPPQVKGETNTPAPHERVTVSYKAPAAAPLPAFDSHFLIGIARQRHRPQKSCRQVLIDKFSPKPILLAGNRLSALRQYAEEQGKGWQEPPQGKERERVRCLQPSTHHCACIAIANTVDYSNEKRELTFKEEGQEYAQVLKMLGNGRLEAMVCSSPEPPHTAATKE
jgi:hypothetical protein